MWVVYPHRTGKTELLSRVKHIKETLAFSLSKEKELFALTKKDRQHFPRNGVLVVVWESTSA